MDKDNLIMKEQLITFQTAKLAKEQGFSGFKANWCYYKDGTILQLRKKEDWNNWPYTQDIRFSAPTKSLLQKWLRDDKKIMVYLEPTAKDNSDFVLWSYRIFDNKNGNRITSSTSDYYENELEKGLIKALNLK